MTFGTDQVPPSRSEPALRYDDYPDEPRRHWFIIDDSGRLISGIAFSEPSVEETAPYGAWLDEQTKAGWLVRSDWPYFSEGPTGIDMVRPIGSLPAVWEEAQYLWLTIRDSRNGL
jgi:hypothetical protein